MSKEHIKHLSRFCPAAATLTSRRFAWRHSAIPARRQTLPWDYFPLGRHPAQWPPVERDRVEHQAGSSTYAIDPTPTGRLFPPLRLNNGQDNLRGMLCVQVDCVVGDLRAAIVVERFSGVGVDVK